MHAKSLFRTLLICSLASFVFSDPEDKGSDQETKSAILERKHADFASRVPSATHFTDVAAFEEFLEKHEHALVVFIDTSSDKMIEYSNAFEAVSSKYKDEIPVAIADVASNIDFLFIYEINMFPTVLRYFNSVDVLMYSFPEVTEKHLMSFMKIKIGKKEPLEVKTIHDVNEILKDYSVVLGLFESVDDENYKSFIQVVSDMDRVSETFAYVIDSKEKLEEFKQAFSPQSQGNVIVIPIAGYPDYESFSLSSEVSLDAPNLYDVISTVRLPVFGQISENLISVYNELNQIQLWFLMTPEKVEEHKKEIVNLLNPLRGQIIAFWLNNSTDTEQAKAFYFNLNCLPSVCLTDPNDSDRRQYFYANKENEKFSIEGLQNFIDSYYGNALTPFVFSEDLSEQELDYSDDRIGKISADVHDRILSNSNYTHVVFYTHESCEECKPLYEHFQQLFENRSQFSTEETKFRFYSFNCAKNQIPDFVPNYPFPPLGLYRNDMKLFFVGSWKDDNVLNFLKNPNDETAVVGSEERNAKKSNNDDDLTNEILDDLNMNEDIANEEELMTEPYDETKKEL